MKRHFALPLALTLAAEFVLFFCLNGKIDASPVSKEPPFTWPAPIPMSPDEVAATDDAGGAPAHPKPDLPSPVTAPETPNPIAIDLPANPIAPPIDSIHIDAGSNPISQSGAGTGFGLPDAAQLDNNPRIRFRQAPVYPYRAKAESMTGEVVVDFVVDLNGRVINPHAVSSTNPVFEEPTLNAVRQWRFEPGLRNGRVVRFRMRVPVEFHLDGN
jgi:protein TonB